MTDVTKRGRGGGDEILDVSNAVYSISLCLLYKDSHIVSLSQR